MWCMMGNYHWGVAEPVLWDNTNRPEVAQCTERFLKVVWPSIPLRRQTAQGGPILLPIFAAGGYWEKKTPMDRLAGFTSLKRWLVNDLKQPPDYWVMTSYPYCDPARTDFATCRRSWRSSGARTLAASCPRI